MSTQLTTIQKSVTPITKQAEDIVIDSPETMAEATELMSKANKTMDNIKAEKETVLAPLREAAGAEKKRWKPLEDVLKPAIAMLRTKAGAYQTAEAKRVREEEEKIAARVKAGKGNLKMETAAKKASAIVKPEEAVSTSAGTLKFRAKKQLKIVDETKIPREYLVVDEKKLLEALKAGTEVAGAEIEEVQVPVNYR